MIPKYERARRLLCEEDKRPPTAQMPGAGPIVSHNGSTQSSSEVALIPSTEIYFKNQPSLSIYFKISLFFSIEVMMVVVYYFSS